MYLSLKYKDEKKGMNEINFIEKRMKKNKKE